MNRINAGVIAGVFSAMLLMAMPAQGQTEIQWWHAHGGVLGERVQEIANGFNASQKDYAVKPVFKNSYAEAMTAGIAAFRAGKPPHILQVFEVGTATLMAAKGAIYPVHELMADSGEKFDAGVYLPTVTGYYTTSDGKMLSMPFNSSTPVLYYNKEGFKKAGLDPEKPPRTWPEFESAAKKLQAAGFACGFTTAWLSWIHLENFSAWHNIPLATRSNGFDGLDTTMAINNPLVERMVSKMAEWQKSKIFDYGGRTNVGVPKFTSGECAMLTESSAGYAGLKRNAKFDFGVGMLPYWPDVKGAPQNTIIGGASLWVLKGHPAAEYKGVARFFNYLSTPEVQATWHQATGYLPITLAAYQLTKKQGYYEKNPGTETALLQMTLNKPTANSRGVRLGNYLQARDVHDEELEAVWAGKASPTEALKRIADRDNELLRQFEQANK